MQPETLWLAPTRPAMKWGVPVEGFYINLYVTFFAGMWLGSPFYWLIGAFNLLPLRALACWDANFFRVLTVWKDTKLATMGVSLFGAPALTPLGAPRARSPEEYPVCV